MIRVDRGAVPAPASLAAPGCYGEKELDDARKYYQAKPCPKKSYEFKAYKEADVAQALRLLFHGKCAYCESIYAATQPVDVEHYRPKGGVEEYPDHTGYWWLAMRWDNLLPSCIDCNRRRRQVTIQPGQTLQELEQALLQRPDSSTGKKDSFPTKDLAWVENEGDPLEGERPLLINPTVTDPVNFFAWRLEGELCVITPKFDHEGVELPEASASIHAYGLNRAELVSERSRLLRRLAATKQQVMMIIGKLSIAPLLPDDRSFLEDLLRAMIAEINVQASPNSPYSAMVRTFLGSLERELEAIA